jgi:DNA-binding transcriptional ArsR family regulator
MVKGVFALKQSKKTYTIKEREVLKILADPLRSQILETVLSEKHTVKQVADKLGLAPSKLYYHFNLLEQQGLIEVVETRLVANMMEKHYQAVYNEIEIDPSILSPATDEGKEVVNTLIVSTIDTTRDDLLRSLQARYFQLEQGAPADPRRIVLKRMTANISNERVPEFLDRIEALIIAFADADCSPDEKNTKPYAMTVAFYPSFYFEESRDKVDNDE